MQESWAKYKPDYTWAKTLNKSDRIYDLDDVNERRLYYNDKVGDEIEYLREYFTNQTILAYWLAPKQAGKGTYMNGLKEIFGTDMFVHLSVGDLVRKADVEFQKEGKLSEIYAYARGTYRGDLHLDKAFDALIGRDTKTLVPTELVMLIIRKAIEQSPRKSLFIDGFPRNLDQVSYALYFRELVNYRNDPDLFILINAPLSVLDERMKLRRTCLKCGNSRNLKLLPTKEMGYDEKTGEFYQICDLPGCTGGRMVQKEGDHLGLESIKDRILVDLQVMERARNLYGIPKIELYNSFDKDKVFDYMSEYEMTKSCVYTKGDNGKVIINKELWEVAEGENTYHSLLPAAVVVQLVKQMAVQLGYKK